ncbi:hypothetical protein G9A89_000836 [Geosiphon pyriformis]|nr:hypothetical protein G9A89_000836 [Geosiphon pyriformis]
MGGCCGSKEAVDGSKPNAQTPLLSRDVGSAYGDSLHNRMNYQRYDVAADLAREQASLQKIVQRAAENLVDISNTHPTERLQHQDAIDRANEYKDLMSMIKLDPKAIQKLQEKSSTLPKIRKKSSTNLLKSNSSNLTHSAIIKESRPPSVILSNNSPSKEDIEWLSKAMVDLHEAIDHIQIQFAGDLVVPLSWATPTPVHG